MDFKSQEDATDFANRLMDEVMRSLDSMEDFVDDLVEEFATEGEVKITEAQVDQVIRLMDLIGLSTTEIERWIRENFGPQPQPFLGSLTIGQGALLIEALENGDIQPTVIQTPATAVQIELIGKMFLQPGLVDQNQAGIYALSNYGTVVWHELTFVQAEDFLAQLAAGAFQKDVQQPPPQGWSPPEVGFGQQHFAEPNPTGSVAANLVNAMDLPQGVYEVVEPQQGISQKKWCDLYSHHAGSHFKGTGSYGFTKIRASADDWGPLTPGVHFWDLNILNEEHSTFTVGASDNEPSDLGPNEDWSNSPRAAGDLGLTAFHKCHFGPVSNNPESWAGYGGKMWLHQQAPHDLLVDRCTFDPVREHHIYSEWVQRLHVTGCEFPDTGGNSIQVASRGGHVVGANYLHGNRLNKPAGLNGWALIENCTINEKHHGFRDSSDITFAGFLGPIVIRNVTFNNTTSAIAIISDMFKGGWIYDDVDWTANMPRLWRKEVEGGDYPDGFWTAKEVWLDDLAVNKDSHGGRAMVMLSGIKDVHIGSFDIVAKDVAAIEINNEYGGPFPCGSVRFYDEDSVERHLGRIGTHNKQTGRFEAYTEEQLADMTYTEPVKL